MMEYTHLNTYQLVIETYREKKADGEDGYDCYQYYYYYYY